MGKSPVAQAKSMDSIRLMKAATIIGVFLTIVRSVDITSLLATPS